MESMFKCDKCGKCCKMVGQKSMYKHLDRGDGICRYFDEDTNLCSIYENRPDICNVDKMYELFYKNILSKSEYYKLNYEACKKIKGIIKGE